MHNSTTNKKSNETNSYWVDIPVTLQGNSGGFSIFQNEPSNMGTTRIVFNNLPDITDSKADVYNDKNIGVSNPSHLSNRTISVSFHFFVVEDNDARKNLEKLRAIQSAVYPRQGMGGVPFQPPPVCRMRCGDLLAKEDLCVVLQSYSVKFSDDVAWRTDNEDLHHPYKFDVNTSWLVA